MKLLYSILAALLINDPVYCESDAKAPKLTDSSIELVDVSSVHGEYHLVLKVRNANPQSISVSQQLFPTICLWPGFAATTSALLWGGV
jgi:hypothetical protein